MKKICSLAIASLTILNAFGQDNLVLTGTVIDAATKEGLPYVNISLLESTVGVVTNETGRFHLAVPASSETDSVQFSFIGYGLKRTAVKDIIGKDYTVRLPRESILLAEAIASPVPAVEYVRKAMRMIAVNQPSDPYLIKGDYYTFGTFRDSLGSATESVFTTYMPSDEDSVAKTHSSLIATRTILEEKPDTTDPAFIRMKKKMNKKTKKKRYQKRVEKNAADSIEDYPMFANIDPLKSISAPMVGSVFLDSSIFDKFDYQLTAVEPYADRRVLVISFESIKKYWFSWYEGTLYMDKETLAFVGIEYTQRMKMPGIAKAAMKIAAGVKADSIISTRKSHYKERNGKWYLSDSYSNMVTKGAEMVRTFAKNDNLNFTTHTLFVTRELTTENVQPIAEEQRLKQVIPMKRQAQNQDDSFWDTYRAVRPQVVEDFLSQQQ